MKRKWLAILLSLALCLSLFSGLSLAAEDEEPAVTAEEIPDEEGIETVFIDVTISVEGEMVLPHYPVLVADEDEDGAYTVYDALITVHGAYYEGEDDGFAVTEEGFITKLWGVENGGSYGYYLNNVMCGGIKDPIENGDYLVAFTYADLDSWSDMYTYFNVHEQEILWGEEVELQLSGVSFDENWNTVVVPVEGAVITIDGEETEFVTDKDGKVVFTLPEGSFDTYYEISAVLEGQVIVPPASDVWVDYSNYQENHEKEFTDVAGHWAEDYIYSVVEEGYLNGVSDTEFAPNANVSRAMLATVLYRIEGEPDSDGENVFSDVADGTWYTDAVTWAAENGIVKGSGGKYRPNDNLTRSEAAVILYRWMQEVVSSLVVSASGADAELIEAAEQYISAEITEEDLEMLMILVIFGGEDFSDVLEYMVDMESKITIDSEGLVAAGFNEEEDLAAMLTYVILSDALKLEINEDALADFADAADIPEWAEEAMAWAVTTGILTGTSDTTISPQMTLTRAQLAVILARMLDL